MKEWAGSLARIVVGAVWVVAGALKVGDPAQSVAAVRAYQLLPSGLVSPVGQLLPVVEIVVGLMLIAGLLTRAVAVVSALLNLAFIIGISSVWIRGINIDCGCFGGGGAVADGTSKYPWELARDTALLVASLFVAWLSSTRLSVDSVLFPRTPPPEGS
jgi:uncharacterized membrane protein YphA (DoxX/SURF4 family)